jgi:hypothetical protein
MSAASTSAHRTETAQAPKHTMLGRAIFDCGTVRLYGGRPDSHLIRQSGKRASRLDQDEFRLERWRNRVHLGREVLFDLLEVGIEDPDDRSRKLLEFV